MSRVPQNEFDRGSVEQLFREQKFAEAVTVLSVPLAKNPLNRETRLYLLLAKVHLDGPEPCEREIDGLRGLFDLDEKERELVRRIFLLGFQAAEASGHQAKTWAYQRLLRRLVLGQPLDQPIPMTEKPAPGPIQVSCFDTAASDSASVHRRFTEDDNAITAAWKSPTKRNLSRRIALGLCAVGLLLTPIAYFISGKTPGPTQQSTTRSEILPQLPPATHAPMLAVEASETRPESVTSEAINEEGLRNLVGKQLTSLRRAYARWMTKNRTVIGTLMLKLTVDPSGKVVAVDKIESDLTDNSFVEIVLAEALKWQFPKARDETAEFTIPLQFVPDDLKPTKIAQREPRLNPARDRDAGRFAYAAGESHKAVKAITKAQSSRTEARPTEQVKPSSSRAEKVGHATGLPTEYKTERALTLREEPRFASGSLLSIDVGTQLSVLEAEGDWLKVKSQPSGVTGYVRKELLASPIAPR